MPCRALVPLLPCPMRMKLHSRVAAIVSPFLIAIFVAACTEETMTRSDESDVIRSLAPPAAGSGGTGGGGAALDTSTSSSTDHDGVGDPDPFSPNHCTGDPLVASEAAKLFAPAQKAAPLGAYTTFRRHRRCHPMTGCEAWSAPAENYGIAHAFGRTELVATGPSNIKIRLRSMMPDPSPPTICTSGIDSPIECSFALEAARPPVSFQPDTLRRTCFALRYAHQRPAPGGGTYELQTVVVGRHRTATGLVAPALEAAPHDISAPCLFCGPGGCNSPSVENARYAIEGSAVRVTAIPGASGPPGSTLVPFDGQGIGRGMAGDRLIAVNVSGPTLAVAISVSGHYCQGVAVLP